MAKMTIKGVTYEGTPEELRGITQLFGEKVGEEEQVLKVGDYVTFTEDVFEHTKGKVSVIRQIDSSTIFKYGLDSPTAESDGWARDGDIRKATDEEIAEATAQKFEVGDYARTLKSGEDGDINAGEIVKIEGTGYGDAHDPYGISADLLDDSCYDFFRPQDLEKLEGKDVERIGQFSKAGRKLDEFKKGDIVRVVISQNAKPEGTIVEVVGVSLGGSRVFDGESFVYKACHVDLIAPVESRVDVK